MSKKGINKHKFYLYSLILCPKTTGCAHCHRVLTIKKLQMGMGVMLTAVLGAELDYFCSSGLNCISNREAQGFGLVSIICSQARCEQEVLTRELDLLLFSPAYSSIIRCTLENCFLLIYSSQRSMIKSMSLFLVSVSFFQRITNKKRSQLATKNCNDL